MSNEWYTPAKYIEAARQVMGSIDLDPASCEMANETVKATTYYTKEQDGLSLPWYDNVWLNPPYNQTGKWTNEAIQRYKEGLIQQAIIAANASTDTHWFQRLFEYVCCFVHGRVNFDNPVRNSIRPRFPSVFIYLGKNEDAFIDVFSQFGTIVRAVRTGVLV